MTTSIRLRSRYIISTLKVLSKPPEAPDSNKTVRKIKDPRTDQVEFDLISEVFQQNSPLNPKSADCFGGLSSSEDDVFLKLVGNFLALVFCDDGKSEGNRGAHGLAGDYVA